MPMRDYNNAGNYADLVAARDYNNAGNYVDLGEARDYNNAGNYAVLWKKELSLLNPANAGTWKFEGDSGVSSGGTNYIVISRQQGQSVS